MLSAFFHSNLDWAHVSPRSLPCSPALLALQSCQVMLRSLAAVVSPWGSCFSEAAAVVVIAAAAVLVQVSEAVLGPVETAGLKQVWGSSSPP